MTESESPPLVEEVSVKAYLTRDGCHHDNEVKAYRRAAELEMIESCSYCSEHHVVDALIDDVEKWLPALLKYIEFKEKKP